ncbi:MAG: RNA 2',3'-cyclic phosphodiesterase [Nitriliruptor sp.]|nr:MAG: RNA 2',3'-cyclic phosphodiesterase [Nitriliruptor sp.]
MTSTHPTPRPVRLFVALPVPPSVRDSLRTPLDRLLPDDARLRPTHPEGWHVTLAFLGDTPAVRLTDVVDVVSAVLARRSLPDRVGLGSPGRFGDHTLWIGLDEEPPGSLGRLGADLQSDLAAADLPVRQRELRPHITIARARRRHRVSQADVRALEQAPGISWRPAGVEIWQSHLGDGPARYVTAASVAQPDTGHQDREVGSDAATRDGS